MWAYDVSSVGLQKATFSLPRDSLGLGQIDSQLKPQDWASLHFISLSAFLILLPMSSQAQSRHPVQESIPDLVLHDRIETMFRN